MAGPHVAGVAALIISHTGKSGGAVAAALQQATNPLPCPDTSIYARSRRTAESPRSAPAEPPTTASTVPARSTPSKL